MNRTAVGVAIGVAGLAAVLLLWMSPSTGPDIAPKASSVPEVQPVATAERAVPPSPKPTARRVRRPVERPGGPPVEGLGARSPGAGPLSGGRPRAFMAPFRDRYTEEGHQRIVERMRQIAEDRGWDDETLAQVEQVLQDGRARGQKALETALEVEGPLDRADLAATLVDARAQELAELEEVLGAEAEVVARKAGIMGRKATRPQTGKPPVGRPQAQR